MVVEVDSYTLHYNKHLVRTVQSRLYLDTQFMRFTFMTIVYKQHHTKTFKMKIRDPKRN